MNNTQPSKPDPKGKAVASFWVGIISFLSIPVAILGGKALEWIGVNEHTIMFPTVILILVAGFTAPIGLILGILGLKSTKRKLAIAGIILSLPGTFLFSAWILDAFFDIHISSFLP